MAEQALHILEGQETLDSDQGHGCKWIDEFKKYGQLDSLSREVAVSLIDDILVYEKKQGERYPRIEVRFRYSDEFQMSMQMIEDMPIEQENAPKEAFYG